MKLTPHGGPVAELKDLDSREDSGVRPAPEKRDTPTAAPAPAPTRATGTFAEELRGRANGFGALRLGFALLVVLDHSIALGGYPSLRVQEMTRGQATLGRLAVYGFFAISGYLITKSAYRGTTWRFLWRRALRILPGYWAALVVGAFVVGPVAWLLSGGDIGDFLSRGPDSPYSYLRDNWLLTLNQPTVHGLFTATPWGVHTGGVGVLSGTLWTLIYEARAYLLVAALMALGLLKRTRLAMPVVAALLLAAEFAYATNPAAPAAIASWLADPFTIRFTYAFAIGGCIAQYADRIPVDRRLAIGSAILFVVSLRYGGLTTVGVPAGVYLTLWLAARMPARLCRIGSRHDFSYGIYLYGFMVQQTLALVGWNEYGYLVYTAVTLVFTVGLAFMSWHLVEKRALALKDWNPKPIWARLGRWKTWYPRSGRSRTEAREADSVPRGEV